MVLLHVVDVVRERVSLLLDSVVVLALVDDLFRDRVSQVLLY